MKALLLLAFGGPRSLDEVESFLTRIMRGRKPSPEQLERVKDRYRLIGGSSPLLEITWGQAKGLEKKLNGKGYAFKSYVGMRYGHPLIEETFEGDFSGWYSGSHRHSHGTLSVTFQYKCLYRRGESSKKKLRRGIGNFFCRGMAFPSSLSWSSSREGSRRVDAICS